MAKIEGFRVKNFRVLKDVTLGRLWNEPGQQLTPITAVIGKNGVGKSTLVDVFGFLTDALRTGVEEACDGRGRRGFEKIRTQGQSGPIEFELFYREHGDSRPIVYKLAIAADSSGRPYVAREEMREDWGEDVKFFFLILMEGIGVVWRGDEAVGEVGEAADGFNASELVKFIKGDTAEDLEAIELEDRRKLGIATLGALKQHPRISAFRRFVEGWHISYFTPDAARSLPLAGPQRHLNVHGDNLGKVVQLMEREHPERFRIMLRKIADKIPGIDKIDTKRTSDGRLLLRFNDKDFHDPFFAQQMSDGTLKVFAYLLLLEDPSPPPFLCIEEPENGLYHKLLEALAQEFRDHATGGNGGSQVFVTTHQPYFVDALDPDEVWVLDKGKDGFASISRASDNSMVKSMVEEGLPLGGLWYSDYLDPR